MIYNYIIHVAVVKGKGRIYMPKLAGIDLNLHKKFLDKRIKLRLIAPLVDKIEGEIIEVDKEIEFVALKYIDSLKSGLKYYSQNKKILKKLLKKGDILHSGGGGFPYFLSAPYCASKVAYKIGMKSLFIMDCDLVGKLKEDQVKREKNYIKKLIWLVFAYLSELNYRKGINLADTAFMLGEGVYEKYKIYSKNPYRIYQPVVSASDLIKKGKVDEKKGHSGPLRVFYLGRLAYEKGIDTVAEAFAKLDKEKYKLDIIGDGPELFKLKEVFKSKGVEVEFKGRVDWGRDLFTLLDKQDIFIIPHRTQEMTRSVFDAMARANGIIAKKNNALKGLIDEAQNGEVYRNNEELVELLKDIIANREKLYIWMNNSRKFCEKYNSESCILDRLRKLERDGFYEDISSSAIYNNIIADNDKR